MEQKHEDTCSHTKESHKNTELEAIIYAKQTYRLQRKIHIYVIKIEKIKYN